jgi:hypothetical protein
LLRTTGWAAIAAPVAASKRWNSSSSLPARNPDDGHLVAAHREAGAPGRLGPHARIDGRDAGGTEACERLQRRVEGRELQRTRAVSPQ